MEILASGITDLGLQREGNEDSFSIESPPGLYVVADGMGGHLAGEVASQVAVDMIKKSFQRWVENDAPGDELFGYPDRSLSRQGNYLLSSIRLANRVVCEMATEYEQYHGMGTTIVALYVTPERIVAANVGDSRIYMIKTGRIERLSKDHTIVAEQIDMGTLTEEEAAASPLKHILTRNLGSANHVDVEIFEIQPSRNTQFILCTDGLTDLVTEKEILDVTRKADHPEKVCRTLVNLSLQRGAPDNTTVVAVFLEGTQEAGAQPLKKAKLLLAKIVNSSQQVVRKKKGG